jgi:hypothetical protein
VTFADRPRRVDRFVEAGSFPRERGWWEELLENALIVVTALMICGAVWLVVKVKVTDE